MVQTPVPFTIEQILPAVLDETLDEVTSWLARLVLLYGVPFSYLLPEEALLPKGSLRFFFLDPIWIQSLVQGACSVGSNDYGTTFIDKAMNELVQPSQPDGKNQATVANQKAARVRDRLRLQYEAVALPQQDARLDWPLTGFLLRSPVVEGWRGVEVMAYKKLSAEEKKTWPTTGLNEEQKAKLEKDGVAPLPPLRIEQLSQDIMLGIFNGIIAQLVIRQPQEGLHFGVTLQGPDFIKTLRELGYKNPSSAGQSLAVTIDLTGDKLLREQERKGVIKVAALANKMQSLLSSQGQLKDGKFTSAEFAVEMIEAAGEFTFQARSTTSS